MRGLAGDDHTPQQDQVSPLVCDGCHQPHGGCPVCIVRGSLCRRTEIVESSPALLVVCPPVVVGEATIDSCIDGAPMLNPHLSATGFARMDNMDEDFKATVTVVHPNSLGYIPPASTY